ncbi:MAG TPA: class I lanthipeptide [Thermoanaerobaculia bacterium]|nr:class I lanthipeptide [Thermoanaerobaculia bacterium]
MKKKELRAPKLCLGRETLRQLQDSSLEKAAGAAWTQFANCTAYSYCTPCIDQ